MKINILGSDYTIVKSNPTKNKKLRNTYGYCDFYGKEIVILDKYVEDESTFNCIEEFANEVLRHELIHAALFESGFTDYAREEELVEWLSVQMPKLIRLMQKAKCL